jgi:Peptidase C13 family
MSGHGCLLACKAPAYSPSAHTLLCFPARLGISDRRIILMLAGDTPCNARNVAPGSMFIDPNHRVDVYPDDLEIDYRGPSVTAANFLAVLSGEHPPEVPASKRLLSDAGSNVLVRRLAMPGSSCSRRTAGAGQFRGLALTPWEQCPCSQLYIAGHGGKDFLKFQDHEEVTGRAIADAVAAMAARRRYRRLLMVADSCQVESLQDALRSTNVVGVASSKIGAWREPRLHWLDTLSRAHVLDCRLVTKEVLLYSCEESGFAPGGGGVRVQAKAHTLTTWTHRWG